MGETRESKDLFFDKDCVATITLMTINEDCDLLVELFKRYREPNFELSSLPYFALFCVEATNRFEDMGISLNTDYGGVFDIKTTRLRLKLFNDKLGKIIKLINKIAYDQDQLFRNKLRFKWLQRKNMYYNLGIFFYKGKLIANTYFLISLFDQKNGHYTELNGEDVKNFAEGIGRTIGKIANLSKNIQKNKPDILEENLQIQYKDVNINKKPLIKIEGEDGIAYGLLLVNVLGNINFTMYLIGDIVGTSVWKLRIRYLSMYYAKEMLARILERIRDLDAAKRIRDCINKLNPVFDLDFRNCMMHYSYSKDGVNLIKEEYFDIQNQLFGLCESCFDGLSIEILEEKVRENLVSMGTMIESLLMIDNLNLKCF